MAPGLTSAGAKMEEDLPANGIAAVYAEGKENALSIGLLKMSTENM